MQQVLGYAEAGSHVGDGSLATRFQKHGLDAGGTALFDAALAEPKIVLARVAAGLGEVSRTRGNSWASSGEHSIVSATAGGVIRRRGFASESDARPEGYGSTESRDGVTPAVHDAKQESEFRGRAYSLQVTFPAGAAQGTAVDMTASVVESTASK